ncbi:protein tbrg4 [Plakobranchus ocellatus]|uniref:Protein tbrg4 n=1 Tax=Plakobranchus ocellatus TaxID=259542 RepID=A0AAV3ZHM2_9GAST|nr:protein tbrg4 [Plakobranchus ocellatus]
MSSLRAVVTTASRGSKHWGFLSSQVIRNGSGSTLRKSLSGRETNFSSSASCLSNPKDSKANSASNTSESLLLRDSKDTLSGEESGSLSTTSSQSKIQSTVPEYSQADNFEELLSASRRIFSPSFRRDCEFRLISWQKKIKDAEKQGKPFDLKDIVSDSLSDVVEFSLTPLALPELRLAVLKILLTQVSDDSHTHRVLQSTASDVMQVPLGIVAEVVRLLAIGPQTELRVETRRSLVMAVINRRWYEVEAKHLVFFMFQMDELFDVKTTSKHLRQKSRLEEQKSNQDTKKGRKNTERDIKSKSEETVDNDQQNVATEIKERIDHATLTNANKEDARSVSTLANVNIESRAISLANELKVKDLARVVSLLSRWNSRNEPLLNVCMHRLSLDDLSTFTVPQLCNLLQAMATLSLHHRVLLENATSQLTLRLAGSALLPAQLCAILNALSLLRWTGERSKSRGRSEDLVSTCVYSIGRRLDQLTVKEAASVLTSLANLSAVPSDESERKVILDLASLVLGKKSPWWGRIHCVWCLSVLQSLEPATAQMVLNSQFVGEVLEKVKESASTSSAQASANKLAQINLAAKLELRDYTGPTLSDEQLGLCSWAAQPSSEQKAAKAALVNTLRKFVDLMTYVDLNPSLPVGATAEALMCANHEGEVRPLVSKEQSGSAGRTEQVQRLAILHIPFAGVNSPEEIPTGLYQMTARHLSLLGYTPVQIFYSDLKPSLSILEKVSNIKARIKTAVQGTSASVVEPSIGAAADSNSTPTSTNTDNTSAPS